MKNHKIGVRLALWVLATPLFGIARASLAQTSNFDMSRFQKNWYVSHDGKPITEVGLSHKEISAVLSKVGADPDAVLALRVDTGEGIRKGLVLQGNDDHLCADGNCQIWFFRKVDGKWEPLVGNWGSDLDTDTAAFAFLSPKHNGLDELIMMRHLSAGRAPVEVWWFDKGKQKYLSNDSYCWDGVEEKAPEGPCQ